MSAINAITDRVARWLPPVLVIVAAAGLRSLETGLLAPESRERPRLAALAGSGGSLAVLGGMRSAVASGFWLRANLAWESRDAAETTALLYLTVAADERPLSFWLNGARMLAYDLPEWRIEPGSPAAWQERIRTEHAAVALAFLHRGEEWRGPAPEFTMEMATIRLRVLGDQEGAARLYRQAAEQPGAPYYAARIHGELLRGLGRPAEALAWLRQILPGLPEDDPAARRDVVEQRIKELESVVGEG
ncbi:MAG: hypothetical protein RL091_971 [Verrucomicrobiota bacterium]|jgi:hypothetical protein